MPDQIGYFTSLKNAAGKVFSYLASITLTGTDGKTVTVTQDTSLGEAVAMSSKAPKVSPSLTTPALGVATATSVNAMRQGAATLTAVPVSSTRTVTITTSGGNGVVDISFWFHGNASGNYGSLKLHIAGYLGWTAVYVATDVVRVAAGTLVLGATTKTNGTVTFTVQNTSGTLVMDLGYCFTANGAVSVAIA